MFSRSAKRAVTLVVITSGVVLASTTAPAAAPPAAGAQPVQKVQPVTPALVMAPTTVTLTDFKFETVDASKSPPVLRYQMKLHNTGNAAQVTVHLAVGQTATTADVAAGAKTDTTVNLAISPDRVNCGNYYVAWLSGAGGDATKRIAHDTSTCTYKSTVTDSLSSMTPDQRHNQEANKVFLANVKVPVFNFCGGIPGIELDVVNNANMEAENLEVSIRDVNNGPVIAHETVTVPKKSTKHLKINTSAISGNAGDLQVKIIQLPRVTLPGAAAPRVPPPAVPFASQNVTFALSPECTHKASLEGVVGAGD